MAHGEQPSWGSPATVAQPRAHKVLVITGGLLNEKETSLARAVKKQIAQWRASESAWLDLKVKLVLAEPVLLGRRELASRRSRLDATVRDYFAHQDNLWTPELTEVVLTTALRQEGMDAAVATVDDIFAMNTRVRALLDECDCVFLSCTLLRDLSEIEPLVQRLRRPHNRLVLGGALAGLLVNGWQGMPGVDVLAVGYGEMLVPSLVEYIRSGFSRLVAPTGGSTEQRQHTLVLRSGVPRSRDLDFLPTPDWAASEREHGKRFSMIHYESVRGCPYRCNFCNYPYLFDDTRFRYKSAQRIADDWEHYVDEMGVEYITCLDSLFTMPRQRLRELCELLVRRNVRVKWICYARADDLAHGDTAAMMKAAGAHQVQIGIESGDQQLLDNMDKQCSVESNHAALANCRQVGLTSVISLIVGFPGETEQTIARTCEFLRATPPDFYFLATFSTRAMGVPVLNDANRRRFALDTDAGLRTVAPYWRHATMSAKDVGAHVRALHRRLMRERVSLNAALFYSGMLRFEAHQREALLDFQQRANDSHPLLRSTMNMAHMAMDWFLARDYERWQHRARAIASHA